MSKVLRVQKNIKGEKMNDVAEIDNKEAVSRESTTSLLDNIIAETKLTQEDDTYDVIKDGVGALIQEMLKSDDQQEKVNKSVVDRMIAEIDEKLSIQVDEILHNKKFQEI